jgi:hypothetical protein
LRSVGAACPTAGPERAGRVDSGQDEDRTARPDEYYRLTRAQEFRKKAARLELGRACAGGLALLTVPGAVIGFGVGVLPQIAGAPIILLASACLFVGLAYLGAILSGLPGRYREEADRLEAEHRARYGVLAARDEPADL